MQDIHGGISENNAVSTGQTILVIEDDWVIRDTLHELLTSEGYQVVTAENGLEGLGTLRKLVDVGAILLDLQMPVMNGEKFLDEVQVDADPRLRSIPVLVLTARREGLHRPVAGLLRKPVDVDVLLSRLRELCGSEAPRASAP